MDIASTTESGYAAIEAGLFAMSVYLTIVTAYLVAAYMVGSKLTNFQLWSVSFLFVAFTSVLALSSFASLTDGMNILQTRTLTGGHSATLDLVLRVGTNLVFMLQLAGIVLAILFMSGERKRK